MLRLFYVVHSLSAERLFMLGVAIHVVTKICNFYVDGQKSRLCHVVSPLF